MKRTKKAKGNGPDVRTWGFAAGAAALLALLTVVLCAMGGMFKFNTGGEATPMPLTTPPPVVAPSPMHTISPDATPRPTPTPGEIWWDINAIAGKGGSMTPSGLVEVLDGDSVTFTLMPDAGYELAELKIDGVAVESGSTYTFENVTESHSLYAVFRLVAASPTPTDVPATPLPPSSPTDIG
ncbi:MAG: hypothetical protein RR314_05905 [Oscillospiraceae bacterium]